MTTARFESLYAYALRFYPSTFRERYAASMRQALRDALGDNSLPRRTLIPLVLRDLVTSLTKEHLAMLRDIFARPALVFNALILTALASGLALALYAIPQQVLRLGADDPQIAMATDVVASLEKSGPAGMLQPGALPAIAGGSAQVDMARSLTPFIIVYDGQGLPLASQAYLNGQTPIPPSGVFDNVRQHGEARISWQPILGRENGVHIAAVIQRIQGSNGAAAGFVLAGRNMREVEAREQQVRQMAGATWIGMLGVILVGTAAFGWYTRPRPA
jgi:hypothetical protein